MKRAIRNTKARSSRSKAAKDVIIREIPAILKADPRARRGIEAAELIVDPPPPVSTPRQAQNGSSTSPTHPVPPPPPPPPQKPPRITLLTTSTLEAAHRLLLTSSPSPSPHHRRHRPHRPLARVAILNMASPLRPGGGVLSGAASQEEHLCARTTLYASLRESFYRLPEVGGIYTPDVLVFRHWGGGEGSPPRELSKAERFYVDVVSAGMLRFPDLEEEEEDDLEEGDGAGAGRRRYAEQKDREMVVRKMRGVLRMVRGKGVDKVVLGAWGCGAYGNPVGEVARAWRRVLLGKGKGRGSEGVGAGSESWDGLEVVFAIRDVKMAKQFATAFGEGLAVEENTVDDEQSLGSGQDSGVEDDDESTSDA